MNQATVTLKALDTKRIGEVGGFDRATQVVDGREKHWTLDEFKALALLDRIRLLAGGEVKFYLKGVEIPARSAIKGL